MTITPDAHIVRDVDVIYASLVDGGVMLNVGAGKYHGVNEVGARIWELLAAPTNVRAICDRLLAEYDVEASDCEAAALAFVASLHERGLVKAVPGSPQRPG